MTDEWLFIKVIIWYDEMRTVVYDTKLFYCSLFQINNKYLKTNICVKQTVVTKKTLLLRKTLIVIIAAMIPFTMYFRYSVSEGINREYGQLQDTINYIIKHEDISKVTLFTYYNDGGMAEYMGIPAYMDARAEVFLKSNNKKEDIIQEYYSLLAGTGYYKDILNKYQFTHLIVPTGVSLYTYLQHDKDYKIVFSNERYRLYKRI